jgi:hypothetical protein
MGKHINIIMKSNFPPAFVIFIAIMAEWAFLELTQ